MVKDTAPTLILSPRITEDSIALTKAAREIGWTVQRLSGWRAAQDLEIPGDICVFGERLFVIFIAEYLPLVYLEPPRNWVATLPMEYTKRKVDYKTLGEARESTFPAFVKPAVDKAFDAGVYNSPSELPLAGDLPDHIPVLVSEIVAWEDEYRCFVVEGEVRTLSIYLRNGELAQASDGSWSVPRKQYVDAKHFAQTTLDSTFGSYPPGFVLDIGQIDGRGWAVLEVNPANASGIYGCDPLEVLNAVRASCILKNQVPPDSDRWIQEFISWDVD